jgi:hypothetical protein
MFERDSHLYHTNHVSVAAPRTPLPCALGMQYLRTAMVLLLGRPAMAMHVSTFLGDFRSICELPIAAAYGSAGRMCI